MAIVVFEQDRRPEMHSGKRFTWRPFIFRGYWNGKPTWRVGWGWWSLSYYPEPGLRDFCDAMCHGDKMWWVDSCRKCGSRPREGVAESPATGLEPLRLHRKGE